MNHTFDVLHARAYGVNCAIIISNFQYWIEKNRANGTHLHDGRTWTYNSINALQKLFPYLTGNQIEYAIKKLVDDGVLMKGKFFDNKYDHRLWYAFCDESLFLTNHEKTAENPISENLENDLENLPKRSGKIHETYNDANSNPYGKPNITDGTSVPSPDNFSLQEGLMEVRLGSGLNSKTIQLTGGEISQILTALQIPLPENNLDTPQALPETNNAPLPAKELTPDQRLFERGTAVLGARGRGLVAKLKKHFDNDCERALKCVEAAAGTYNPFEYIGAIINKPKEPPGPREKTADDYLDENRKYMGEEDYWAAKNIGKKP